MNIEKRCFGVLSDGREAELYTMRAGELSLSVSTFGATLTSLLVPSAAGRTDDVLLGYADFSGYAANRWYFGVTVGRFANRISGARFNLDGAEHQLSRNKPDCSLHGGQMGFSRRLWRAYPFTDKGGAYLRLVLDSPDGDQGYPGAAHAAVTYGVTENNELTAHYECTTDKPCPINLTNHAYFNLAGENSGQSVLSTTMRLHASRYVEVGERLIPTGRLVPAQGAMDFSEAKALGRDIAALPGGAQGYDHCYAIDGRPGELRLFAELSEPTTKRRMSCYATTPGVQVYTGNMLTTVSGKIGSIYEKHSGICLEPEYFPDSPNVPEFPSCICTAEKPFDERSVFSFAW